MDIHYIRENPDKAKENQQKRFNDPSVIDEILVFPDIFIRSSTIAIFNNYIFNNIYLIVYILLKSTFIIN
jgi:hypothetical protein